MAFVPSIYPVIRGYEILPFPQAPQLFQPAPELLDCPGKKQRKRIDDTDLMFQEILFITGLKYQLSILKREVIQGKKLRIVNFHNTKLMRISIR